MTMGDPTRDERSCLTKLLALATVEHWPREQHKTQESNSPKVISSLRQPGLMGIVMVGVSFPTSAFDTVVSLTIYISSENAARSMCNAYIMIFNSNDGDLRSHGRVARTTGGFKCSVI